MAVNENSNKSNSNSYFELKIKINPQMSEVISGICFDNFDCEGIITAEEEYKDDLVLVSTTENTLKVYLKNIQNVKEILEKERNLLLENGFTKEELGSWEFEIVKVKNQDWSQKWKENWDVTTVSDKIKIVPSWIKYEPKPDEIIITLDPGAAFGTGTHPTTQLCMRATEKYMKINDSFADIGTGSGILAICGVKLKAKFAYGCDNDESVIKTAIENAKINNVADKCKFEQNTADKINSDVIINSFKKPNDLTPCDGIKFDFITANILHNVLADIMEDLKNLMADNAILVLSGILDEKKDIVIDAIKKHDLTLIEELHQDIWTALVIKK